MIYKPENRNTYSIAEGGIDYDEWSEYDTPSPPIHALAHIMAAGLTNPNHFMDFEEAKNHLPFGNKQIAGYEAEAIAKIYHDFLAHYPDSKEIIVLSEDPLEPNTTYEDGFRNKDFFLAWTKEYVEYAAINTLDSFKCQLAADAVDLTSSHTKNHKKYLLEHETDKGITYPPSEEMSFHFDKAKEFCESFKEKHGEYPSDIYAKRATDELAKLPLKEFEIENYYINQDVDEKLDPTRHISQKSGSSINL